MKKQIINSVLVLSTFIFLLPAHAGGVMKEVCEPEKDKAGKVIKNKDGSDKQICKKIKVHKKVEGTKVPPK